jgi:hypothetical protein
MERMGQREETGCGRVWERQKRVDDRLTLTNARLAASTLDIDSRI